MTMIMESIQENFQIMAMNISIQIVIFLKAAFKIQVIHKQKLEKKRTLRCARSLLFAYGEKTQHYAKRARARYISSLVYVYHF